MSSKHKTFRGRHGSYSSRLCKPYHGVLLSYLFLSHAFGEENVGLYQLVFPVYALCLALSTSGIQTAVSHMTAEKTALKKNTEARSILGTALGLTLLISFAEILFIQKNAAFIAMSFLGDERCTDLLMIISYALPCAAVHSCICGYYLGLQKTGLPAVSQLIEQAVRILSVLLLFVITRNSGRTPSIHLAAAGIAAGEFVSALFAAHSLSRYGSLLQTFSLKDLGKNLRELLGLSVPLTSNRTVVTLLQSIEAASIPVCLRLLRTEHFRSTQPVRRSDRHGAALYSVSLSCH